MAKEFKPPIAANGIYDVGNEKDLAVLNRFFDMLEGNEFKIGLNPVKELQEEAGLMDGGD